MATQINKHSGERMATETTASLNYTSPVGDDSVETRRVPITSWHDVADFVNWIFFIMALTITLVSVFMSAALFKLEQG